jgi:hypothetical protein
MTHNGISNMKTAETHYTVYLYSYVYVNATHNNLNYKKRKYPLFTLIKYQDCVSYCYILY